MTIEERAELAADWKKSGWYNCSQAVVLALDDQTNLSECQLGQAASGFAVGMGNMEGTCGSLIGAGMIAGLHCEGKNAVHFAKQISENFCKRSGAVICKELKGKETGKLLCSCENCVRNAILAYGEVMGLK